MKSLKDIMMALYEISRVPEDRGKQQIFRSATEFLLAEFESDADSSFQLVLSDLYEVMAHNYYTYGYLNEFTFYTMMSKVTQIASGKQLERDKSVQDKFMRVLLKMQKNLLAKMDSFNEETDKHLHDQVLETINLIFGDLGLQKSFLVLSSLPSSTSRIRSTNVGSLEELSHLAFKRLGHISYVKLIR